MGGRNSLLKKSLETDWALPWAHENYIIIGENQTDQEFESDILFARSLEGRGFGLRAKADKEEIYRPEEIVFPDRTIITLEGIERFVKRRGLEFGNSFHIDLRDAYSYLNLFNQYRQFHPLG
jgi:hypothetical protein